MEITGFSPQSMMYLIPKGSICVEGVSLTINEVHQHNIKLMLVPHTLLHTSLSALTVGQTVNIEFDMIGKYVNRLAELKINN